MAPSSAQFDEDLIADGSRMARVQVEEITSQSREIQGLGCSFVTTPSCRNSPTAGDQQ
jgi:hypothetical protein